MILALRKEWRTLGDGSLEWIKGRPMSWCQHGSNEPISDYQFCRVWLSATVYKIE